MKKSVKTINAVCCGCVVTAALLLTSCESIGGSAPAYTTRENIYDTNDAPPPATLAPAAAITSAELIPATPDSGQEPSLPNSQDSATTSASFTNTAQSQNYMLSAEQSDFISRTTFIGDSICSGLSVYRILPSSQVFAVGDTAARNILDPMFTFTDPVTGQKTGLIQAVADAKPPVIAISFGMNDINITGTEAFTDNYISLIQKLQAADPGVKVVAVSITPISVNSNFAANSKIDKYNTALKAAIEGANDPNVIYADANALMKNGDGDIIESYIGSTDGVHLNPGGYSPILYAIADAAQKHGFF